MNFKRINTIAGWIVFAIATITYLMTVERTTSFWDCGEFIITAYKLQVAHSPGAPLFMLIGRMFTMLAPHPEMVGFFANSMSAFASSFTILFLFWIITHFARKIVAKEENDAMSNYQIFSIIGAGAVGALAYTFSDTFWFSAVEAEVYATSSFFTALTFWAILKWEHIANTDARADRWLILIFFLIGLSIGVHLLNLLTIPSIILVYYLRRYKNPTLLGGFTAFLVGGVILGIVQFGIIQYISKMASWFELTFTNGMGMPFNTGTFVFLLLISAAIFFVIRYAKKKNKYLLYLSTFCFAFTLLGFAAPYASTIIRSKADVPIDMVNPDNVVSLIPYLQREQYGSQPILTGANYNFDIAEVADGGPIYAAREVDGKARYVEVGQKQDIKYSGSMLFPRMWDRNKAELYADAIGIEKDEAPSFGNNMSYFFNYQVNWMWWRYFMWNYAGRQNDYQGQGEAKNGNWLSGIKFLDKAMGKGDIDKASESYKNNEARNEYYMLPFILGLLGLFYHYKKDKADTAVVFSLFLMTGIAIVVFLNNSPMQPRERDYAYISTFPFAIWIGIGVMQVAEWLKKFIKGTTPAVVATAICLVCVPLLMLSKNYDDHNRAPKRLARDHAYNMLMSCDTNAILIVNGDNDTYPLWYLQEVEGVRPDVRIFNHNLLNTDWQIEQMFYKINKAPAVTMFWKPEDVQGTRLEVVYFVNDPRLGSNYVASPQDVISFITNKKNERVLAANKPAMPYIPTKNVSIPIDKAAVANSGLLNGLDSATILDEIRPDYNSKNFLYRADLSILNMVAGIAKDGWKRSIYFASGTPAGGFEPYLQRQGLLSKLVPTTKRLPANAPNFTGGDKNINLLTKVFTLGNANTDKPYYDEKAKNSLMQYRYAAYELAIYLNGVGRTADGVKVLDHMTASMSESSYPNIITVYDKSVLALSEAYYRLGAKDKGKALGNKMVNAIQKDTDYFMSLNESRREGYMTQQQLLYLQSILQLSEIAGRAGDKENSDKWMQIFQTLAQRTNLESAFRQQAAPQPQPQQKTIGVPGM